MNWRRPRWARWIGRDALALEDFVSLSLRREPAMIREVVRAPAPPITREEYDAAMAFHDARREAPPSLATECAEPVKVSWALSWGCDEGRARLTELRDAIADGQLPAGVRHAADGPLHWQLHALVQWAARAGWEMPVELLEAVRPRGQQPNDGREAAQAVATTDAKPRHAASDAPKRLSARREAVLAALAREYGDVHRLPFYLGGDRSGDPALQVARAALATEKPYVARKTLQDLAKDGEIGPRHRNLSKGDPRLARIRRV